eukprot:CAMPEP_0175149016 /NCGR_PEP_ID=MMETSP0087-20121206/16978_1 /TAXON_ID=136419 /ORGANISM="Unknown Unknown, Strain D1" /LENGTH=223 /DNA_ID=CAMNT_0016434599 /DNA_START=14 /DNA_END=686 /DNA_ORIENTATION=+
MESKNENLLPLVFVTGNKGKLQEVGEILGDTVPNLTNRGLDLPELQGEPEDIAKEKCQLASKALDFPAVVMVEDTSLCYNALNGLPGPYIKWFLEKTGHAGLNNMLAAYEDKSAYSQCIFALQKTDGSEPVVFCGRCPGTIVPARGDSNHFGGGKSWDPVFQPDGFKETFAEMAKTTKNSISHRSLALQKLKEHLDAHPEIFHPEPATRFMEATPYNLRDPYV